MQWSGEIRPGMDVYDVDGDKLGTVREVSEGDGRLTEGAGYLQISTGGHGLGRPVYVPLSIVREIRADGVYLDMVQDDAERLDGESRTPVADPLDEQLDAEVPRSRSRRPARSPREQTVELREEVLQAHKEKVQTGELGIRKEVITEERTLDVPVMREEVVIERRPVERKPARDDIAEGEALRVPVWAEQVQVEKQAVVVEELRIGKHVVEETQQVTDTVRREEARIEREGEVAVRSAEDL